MTAELVSQLAHTLDVTGQLIAAVGDEQWERATPCADWTVRDVVAHLTLGNRLFADIVRGERPDVPGGRAPDTPSTADGLRAQYRESARALVAAFGQPGVFESVFAVPIGSVPGVTALHLRITETLVHGWDLAVATGQPAPFPEDLAAQELEFTRGALASVPPGGRPFAPPQPVPEDAPALDQLAGCLGRNASGQRFAALVEAFAARPDVQLPGESAASGFGSAALKVNGSIFSMLTRGHLVVKLPAQRVAGLIKDGTGQPFDAGKGTPMKQWLTVSSGNEHRWRSLAEEALTFVRDAPGSKRAISRQGAPG